MQILVTGGLGYIGSHTVVELIQAGYEVVIIDNLVNAELAVLKHLETITNTTITFYQIDLTEKDKLEQVFSQHHFAGVIHFAGYKAVGESVENPLKYYQNNLVSSLNLLFMLEKYQVEQLIFSSSATVYGDPVSVPIKESAKISPTNPYGQTKAMIETMMQDYVIAHPQTSIVSLRYFNPVGAHKSGLIGEKPKGTPNNLFPYMAQVTRGERDYLRVFGADYPTKDGTGVRDYLHITDLALGHIKALAYTKKHPGIQFINLGTGQGYSVLEVIVAFSETNQVTIPYQIFARRPGDIAICYADPSLAKQLLNWETQFDLAAMCRDLWYFYQKNSV